MSFPLIDFNSLMKIVQISSEHLKFTHQKIYNLISLSLADKKMEFTG
jgi:hypothetical protein